MWPALCLAPYLAFGYYEKAVEFEATGELEKAEAELRKAISHNSGQAFFYHRLGNIMMEKFSSDRSEETHLKASEAFRKAIQINSVHPQFWVTLAKYHEFRALSSNGMEKQKHMAQTIAAYREAIRLAPTNPFYLVNSALVLVKVNLLEETRKQLEAALALEPNFITAHALLVEVYDRLGLDTESILIKRRMGETMRRVSRHKPKNAYEKRLLMEPSEYFKGR